MDKPETKTTGQRIRQLRRGHRWTQDQLCSKANVSKSFLSEIENDAAKPGGQILIRLANALEASVDYLLTGREARARPQEKVEIMPSLAAFAEKRNIPYQHVMALQDVFSSIEARRRAQGERILTEKEWGELYEKIRAYL